MSKSIYRLQKSWDSISKALDLPKSKFKNTKENFIELSHPESLMGENNFMYGLKGKNHPAHHSNNNYRDNPQYRKNLSKAQMGHEYWARHYNITTPDGDEIKIRNLNKFCRENNLSSGTMTLVAKGIRNHYKDYKVKYV